MPSKVEVSRAMLSALLNIWQKEGVNRLACLFLRLAILCSRDKP